MRNCVIAFAALLICGMAASAEAQVITTYLPPAPPVVAAPVVVARPAPIATYYSAPALVAYPPRRYVVPAPVVVAPRVYTLRPKVYVRGQPLRNTIRAVTP